MHEPRSSEVEDDQHIFQKLLGYYDAPAFVRRVKRVEDAERILGQHLHKKRTELLAMVRLRVGQLHALAGSWDALGPLLAPPPSRAVLQALYDTLQPELRMPLKPTRSARALRSALTELRTAIETFNRRWNKLVTEIDLSPLNELRDGYNRHYLIEKECALRNGPIARIGFKKLEPITVDDLFGQFPLLALP